MRKEILIFAMLALPAVCLAQLQPNSSLGTNSQSPTAQTCPPPNPNLLIDDGLSYDHIDQTMQILKTLEPWTTAPPDCDGRPLLTDENGSRPGTNESFRFLISEWNKGLVQFRKLEGEPKEYQRTRENNAPDPRQCIEMQSQFNYALSYRDRGLSPQQAFAEMKKMYPDNSRDSMLKQVINLSYFDPTLSRLSTEVAVQAVMNECLRPQSEFQPLQ